MRRRHSVTYLILGTSLMLLTACGFHLRGYDRALFCHSIPALQLENPEPYSEFSRTLVDFISQYQIQIISSECPYDSLKPDTWILTVSNPEFTERPLSYSSDGQTNYLILEMKLKFEAKTASGTCRIPTQTLILSRPMSVQPNAFLNNDYQRALLKKTLYQEATLQILHKLSAEVDPDSLDCRL